MADEIKKEEGTGLAAPEPKQFTELEKRALDQGWRPKEEWDGEPDAWRPAKEFLDRGELFKKIDDQNRTIKEFRKALDDLSRHHAKVAQVEYARALHDLKAQKKEALEESNAEAVVEIDERIAAVREAQKAAAAQPPVQVINPNPELNPVFVEWKSRNSWYDHNEAMRAFADRVGNKMQGASPTEILQEVERQVKKEFAHKFENPKRNAPSAVEGGSNKSASKKEDFQLTDEQRRVANQFIKRIPGYTMEKYIAELKKVEGL